MHNPNHMRTYIDAIDGSIEEKWGKETKVSPQEKGKYKGRTKSELQKQYNRLKASGPHHKGSPEYEKMKELSFAIRAKSGWGDVKENIEHQKESPVEAEYTDMADHCNLCQHFIPKNSCEIVEGPIRSTGWCRHFSSKVEIE